MLYSSIGDSTTGTLFCDYCFILGTFPMLTSNPETHRQQHTWRSGTVFVHSVIVSFDVWYIKHSSITEYIGINTFIVPFYTNYCPWSL